MQRGGHVPAHERMASGEPIQWQQGPVGERRRMDYRNYVTPGVARRQLARQGAAGGPGRAATSGIGGKAGGSVKKKTGGSVKKKTGGSVKKMQRGGSALTHMAEGDPIQWQQGPVGKRRRLDYINYVAPGVAKRQLARQEAAGGPGRRAANIGPGGWKKGGKVSNRSGFNLYGYKKGGSVKTR